MDIKRFKAFDGAEIKYADEGSGQPVVYIYGIGSSIASAEALINNMKQYCRFIVFDQRAFGVTEGVGEIGIHQSARDARALIEYLGLKDVILFGYSMGAACVFSYVEQYGCAGLKKILIGDMSPKLINEDGWNLGLYQGHYTRAMYEEDLVTIKNDYKRFALILTEQLMFKHTPDEARDFSGSADDIRNRIISRDHNELVRNALFTGLVDITEDHQAMNYYYWVTMCSADFRDTLKNITVPTGLLYADPGSGYQPRTAEFIGSQVASAEYMPMYGCTHMCSAENPKQFTEYLIGFFTK